MKVVSVLGGLQLNRPLNRPQKGETNNMKNNKIKQTLAFIFVLATLTIGSLAQPAPTPPTLISNRCSTYAAPTVPVPLNTYYIDAENGNDIINSGAESSPWKTLQKANSIASEGDLFLLKGVFVNQWINPSNSGTEFRKITYRKKPGAIAILEATAGAEIYGVTINAGQSHIVIDGLEIRNTPAPFQVTNNSHHIWLRNLYIHDSGQSTFRYGANNNRLEDSVLTNIGSDPDNSGDALSLLNDADNNTVVRNYFGNAGHSAYNDDIQGSSFGQNENNIVAQNVFNNQWASNFILAGRSIGTLAECNIMKNASQETQFNYPRPGIQLDGKFNTIRYNFVYNNKADGMLIEGRVFSGQQMFAESNNIYQNTFVGNGRSGIYMDIRDLDNQTGTNAYIKNNVIENNIFWGNVGNAPSNGTNAEIVISFYFANSQWANGFTDGNVFRYNNFSNIPVYNFVGMSGVGNFTIPALTILQSTYPIWTSNRQQNPLFKNSSINDYSLSPNSPTIDQGRLIPGVIFNGSAPDLGAIESKAQPQFDFDGDGKSDIGNYSQSTSFWKLLLSTGGTSTIHFGISTDKIVPADYDGDRKTDIAIYRNGVWWITSSSTNTVSTVALGNSTDIPAPGDFDGDGKADQAVFRASTGTWYINKSTGSVLITAFGSSGDIPVVGDYDNDAKVDVAIFRPSSGQWWINRSTDGLFVTTFGTSTDKVVPADYTGDGKTDVAVWRPSTGGWFILRSEDLSFYSFPFGTNGDLPASADYDGDGKVDPTVFRPSTATWYLNRSSGGIQILSFGAVGDKPVAGAYVQ
jgi:hypothetical protein